MFQWAETLLHNNLFGPSAAYHNIVIKQIDAKVEQILPDVVTQERLREHVRVLVDCSDSRVLVPAGSKEPAGQSHPHRSIRTRSAIIAFPPSPPDRAQRFRRPAK